MDLKAARVHGIGLGCFFFVIFAAYALGELFASAAVVLTDGLIQLLVLVLLSSTITMVGFLGPFHSLRAHPFQLTLVRF